MGAHETLTNMLRITPKPRETCGELYEAVREQYGISLRAFQMRFANVTGNSFAKNREVTAKEKAAIREAYPKKEILKRTSTVRNKAGESPVPKAVPGNLSKLLKWAGGKLKGATNAVKSNVRKYFLIALMSAPAIASWQNMNHVVGDIVQDSISTMCFTIAFTASPFVFVLFGIRAWWLSALTALLIGVEVFCNAVRIYAGLTGFGHSGNPTRFLGVVCELLNTGTYQTATALAFILSLMAAGVFYAAYLMIKK